LKRSYLRRTVRVLALLGLLALLLTLCGCALPQHMCTAAGECGTASSCVAGRCIANGAVPAIATARRLLYAPVDVAYLRRGGADGMPEIATLGGSDGAIALLRFVVPLPAETTVLEAYLLLERATDVDSDPTVVALHAARVVERWDGRSVSWARPPRIEEVGAPVTRVPPASGPWVRLDMRELVQRWRRRGSGDFGVAVLAENSRGVPSSAGLAVALTPMEGRADPGLSVMRVPLAQSSPIPQDAPQAELVGPRLELYVR
jgi:hypothetical protein